MTSLVQQCENFVGFVKELKPDETVQIEGCRGGLSDLRDQVLQMPDGDDKKKANGILDEATTVLSQLP